MILSQSKQKAYTYVLLSSLIVLFPFLLIILITEKSITNYQGSIKPTEEFCLKGYFPLPSFYNIKTPIQSEKEIKEEAKLFNKYTIFAKEICLKPTTLLPENTKYVFNISYLDLLNLGIFQKKISLTTESYPKIKALDFESEINNNQILKYEVDYSTNLIDYSILSDKQNVSCSKDNSSILCDVSSLNLKQGSTYEIKLVGKYKDKIVKQLDTTKISIRTAVEVVNSNIENNVVLQNPTIPVIDITFNKEIKDKNYISIKDSNNKEIKYEATIDGKILHIYPSENFEQAMIYSLNINDFKGVDGSYMEKEYVLTFSIDTGPKLVGTNISNVFPTTGSIVLNFNQNISSTQNIKGIITFDSGTGYSYAIRNNQVIIDPNSQLALCQKYSINIHQGLVSDTGLVSPSSYSYTLKTTCKRTAVIGTSVQGRSIYAYYFGTGSKEIVFFASIHGSESNTQTLLNKWATELDNNSDNIPADKTIIVIPTVNPDGIANRSRFNANGVDLNRNFDTPSWTSGTYLQNSYYPTGGGAYPFSEPESTMIRDFVTQHNPYLTLTYHSAAGYVIPTNTSRGIDLGHIYSQLTGYQYVVPGGEGAFTYDITGTFEEWAENHGYNALVVELSSAYYDQFSINKNAMWNMVGQ